MKGLLQRKQRVRVGEVLVQKGLITQGQLRQALDTQRETKILLGEVLISEGLVTERQLNRALSEQYWRNAFATLMVLSGTLLTNQVRLVNAQTAVISPLSGNRTSAAELASQNQANYRANSIARNNGTSTFIETPLAANPTEASPLLGFCNPLQGRGRVSQGYRGVTHRGRMEYAIDYAVGIGTPVYAMRSGRVVGMQDKYPDTGGGKENISKFNYIWIEHDGGYRSAYLHLQQGFRSKVNLKVGDRIQAGQLIGFSGNSGWSSGPHLHVEIQRPASGGQFGQTVAFNNNQSCTGTVVAQNAR